MAKKKIAIMLGLLGAALVLSISFVTAKSGNTYKGELEQTTLQVSNLSCGSCLATIEGELQKYEGMVEMSADLSRGLVTVGHTADFGEEQIAQAITAVGYPARVVSEVDLAALAAKGQGDGAFRGSGCGSRGCGTGGCGSIPPAAQNR